MAFSCYPSIGETRYKDMQVLLLSMSFDSVPSLAMKRRDYMMNILQKVSQSYWENARGKILHPTSTAE